MKKHLLIFISFLLLFISGCQSPRNVLQKLTTSDNDLLRPVFNDPEKYELQILYTQIDTLENGKVEFRDFSYRLDPEAYFYPASTVKLPIAALALEKLKDFEKLDKSTPYIIEGDSLEHSIAKDIEAIFAVSDNEAYNRLFELLGQDYINSKLMEKGLNPVRISHRLSTDDPLRIETRKITFKISEKDSVQNFEFPTTRNQPAVPLNLKSLEKGLGYLENDSLVNQPFNFSLKNYFPLQVQHQLMKQLIFPKEFAANKRFDLADEDREFLLRAMAQLPSEAGYDEEEYNDSYVKFFLYGDSKDPIPREIRIYNKVGYAYGTLTETAYIKDASRNIAFLLSATLLVNKNGIFNDNNYEYESLGIPFLAALGREIYELELNRNRKK